jgi:tripartite-type tricarboxylate transporter receptor subunit TctC
MPAAVVAKLNETLNKALATADLRERFVTLGAEPYAGTPQQITELVRADVDKMAKTIKAANIKSE